MIFVSNFNCCCCFDVCEKYFKKSLNQMKVKESMDVTEKYFHKTVVLRVACLLPSAGRVRCFFRLSHDCISACYILGVTKSVFHECKKTWQLRWCTARASWAELINRGERLDPERHSKQARDWVTMRIDGNNHRNDYTILRNGNYQRTAALILLMKWMILFPLSSPRSFL